MKGLKSNLQSVRLQSLCSSRLGHIVEICDPQPWLITLNFKKKKNALVEDPTLIILNRIPRDENQRKQQQKTMY